MPASVAMRVSRSSSDRRAGAGLGGSGQVGLERPVRHAEDREVHRLREARQVGEATMAEQLVVLRVDRVDAPAEPALGELDHHLLAEALGTAARPHDRHAPGLEHGDQRGALVRLDLVTKLPLRPVLCHEGCQDGVNSSGPRVGVISTTFHPSAFIVKMSSGTDGSRR
jgi:hypothetical protein